MFELTACKKAPTENGKAATSASGNISQGSGEKIHVLDMQPDSSDSGTAAANVVTQFNQEQQQLTAATNAAVQRATSLPKLQSDDAPGLDAAITAKDNVMHALQAQIAFTQGWQSRLDEIIKAQHRPGLEYDAGILKLEKSFRQTQPLLLELYAASLKFYSTDVDVLVVVKANFDHRHPLPDGRLAFDDKIVQKKFDEMVTVNQQASASLAQVKAKVLAQMQNQKP